MNNSYKTTVIYGNRKQKSVKGAIRLNDKNVTQETAFRSPFSPRFNRGRFPSSPDGMF